MAHRRALIVAPLYDGNWPTDCGQIRGELIDHLFAVLGPGFSSLLKLDNVSANRAGSPEMQINLDLFF